jgi:hypothetical protein
MPFVYMRLVIIISLDIPKWPGIDSAPLQPLCAKSGGADGMSEVRILATFSNGPS